VVTLWCPTRKPIFVLPNSVGSSFGLHLTSKTYSRMNMSTCLHCNKSFIYLFLKSLHTYKNNINIPVFPLPSFFQWWSLYNYTSMIKSRKIDIIATLLTIGLIHFSPLFMRIFVCMCLCVCVCVCVCVWISHVSFYSSIHLSSAHFGLQPLKSRNESVPSPERRAFILPFYIWTIALCQHHSPSPFPGNH
jgi:hypothetical protein